MLQLLGAFILTNNAGKLITGQLQIHAGGVLIGYRRTRSSAMYQTTYLEGGYKVAYDK